MDKVKCVIVLGAQCGLNDRNEMDLAPHTKMRARAAGIMYQRGLAEEFILSGGHNFGVRYDRWLSTPVFGTPKSDRKPDFSVEAKNQAHQWPPEAALIGHFMMANYGVPWKAMFQEEDSYTTKDNAKKCKTILEDSGITEVGLLSQLFHLGRPKGSAITEFREELGNIKIIPIPAEDLLVMESPEWIQKICEYYSAPKGDKLWAVAKIRQLLTEGKSLVEMLTRTVYVVRKHITGARTGHEDYPEQFRTQEEAQTLLTTKQAKYQQTVEDYIDEGSAITEGRRYEIVPLEVPI